MPPELDEPESDLVAAMRARMGIADATDDENPDPDDLEPGADDPGHEDSPGAVPGMGADGGGGGQEAEPPADIQDDEDDSDDPDDSPAPATPPVPVESEFIDIDGFRIPRAQAAQARQLIEWAQQQILNAPEPGTPATAAPAPAAEEPAFDPEAFVDPDLARAVDERFTSAVDPLAEKIDRLLSAEDERARVAMEQRNAELAVAETAALTTVAEKYGLTAEQADVLNQRAVPFLKMFAEEQAPPQTIFEKTLEAALWNTPEFREAQVQAAARAAAEEAAAAVTQQQQADQRQTKKTRAGLLAGGSSSITRQTAPPQTKEERRAAFVEALRKVDSES